MDAPIRPIFYVNFLKPPLPALVSFARSSAGYRINEKGLLESVSSGQPRFDHWPFDGVTGRNGAVRGLLIEGARTNDALWNEDATQHSLTNASISANLTLAPDGQSTADKLIEDNTTNSHRYLQGGLPITDADWCISGFFKAAGRMRIALRNNDNAAERGCDYDLSGGTVAAIGTGITRYGIQRFGGDWFFCWYVRTMVSGNPNPTLGVYLMNGAAQSYAGDGSSGVYMWGVGCELGSFPTSYVKTTSAPVTRAAEAASVPLSSIPGFNAAQGTLFAEWIWPGDQPTGVAGKHIAVLHDGSNSNAIKLLTNGGSNEYAVRASGAEVAAGNAGAPTANVAYRSAVAWDTDNFLAATQGVVFGADTAGAVPSGLTTLQIGGRDSGTEPMNGYLRQLALFPRRSTAAELQRLTAW